MDDEEIWDQIEHFTEVHEQIDHAKSVWKSMQKEILNKIQAGERTGLSQSIMQEALDGNVLDEDFLMALVTVGYTAYAKELERGVMMSGYVAMTYGVDEALKMMKAIEDKK